MSSILSNITDFIKFHSPIKVRTTRNHHDSRIVTIEIGPSDALTHKRCLKARREFLDYLNEKYGPVSEEAQQKADEAWEEAKRKRLS